MNKNYGHDLPLTIISVAFYFLGKASESVWRGMLICGHLPSHDSILVPCKVSEGIYECVLIYCNLLSNLLISFHGEAGEGVRGSVLICSYPFSDSYGRVRSEANKNV